MTDTSAYQLYGAVFLAVLFLVEGIYLLCREVHAEGGTTTHPIRALKTGGKSGGISEALRRRPMKPAHHLGFLGSAVIGLDRLIAHSGLTVSTGRVLLVMAVLAFLVALFLMGVASAGVLPMTVAGLAGGMATSLILGIGVPVMLLRWFKARRLKKFSKHLPEALDVMARSLGAGHPISAALALVSTEMVDPVGTEFGIAVDEITYGLNMRDALENLSRRIELQEFQYVVVAINIQHETGGNLAEVLRGLAAVLRARFRMFKKIKGLSGEGRLSAVILSVMPLAVGGLVFLGNPDFYLAVADDPLFWPLLAGAAGLMLVGICVMHRLVNFRV